ncbi:DUF3429 domain-containing protein [Stappia indica]|uniref:DUF3429 domain-containing protein n=1 Tax=Stappia indica TaxID=538381 RepID=A0A285SRC1_9HYPH|nr:DUF3429 domain-containing protein [Stappia indica]SOC10523.1 Protein of unknown function [Stappia indica]
MAATKPDLTRFAAQPGPAVAVRLGYAGLLPFVFAAFYLSYAAIPGVQPPFVEPTAHAAAIYGAVILSFLGGVRWGIAMAGRQRGMREFVLSVLPSLLGWGAALLPPVAAMVVLAGGFLMQAGWDQRAAATGSLPLWYATLRRRLSVVVTVALLVAAAGLLMGRVA